MPPSQGGHKTLVGLSCHPSGERRPGRGGRDHGHPPVPGGHAISTGVRDGSDTPWVTHTGGAQPSPGVPTKAAGSTSGSAAANHERTGVNGSTAAGTNLKRRKTTNARYPGMSVNAAPRT
ncbi:Hypothetical predicted protein, partial [Scomber scombrus]